LIYRVKDHLFYQVNETFSFLNGTLPLRCAPLKSR